MTRKLASISSICEVNPHLPARLRSQEELSVSFVPMSTVQGSGFLRDVETRQLRDVLKGYTYFEGGDVLVAKITPCMENGKVAQAVGLPHPVGFGSTEFHVLRPGPGVDGRYLFHMIWTPRFRQAAAASMTGTGGQRRVPVSFFARCKIPLPPLPEQRRIAAILDKADAVRRKRQQTLDLADQFLHSAFHDMFGDPVTNPKGWPERRLDFLAEIRGGVTKGRKLDGRHVVTVPYVRVANVQDGFLDLREVKQIVVLGADVDKYRLVQGDVLLTEGGDPDKLGRGAVWTGEIDPCIHQNHIFSVRVDAHVAEPQYISALLGSAYGKRYFLRAGKQTTGIATINRTQLSGFPALLPPLALQSRFAAIVATCGDARGVATKRGKDLDALSATLTERAFQGGL